MMQKPPAYQTFVVGWNDVQSMAKGADIARHLRLDNVIENGVIGNTLYAVAQLVKRSEIYKGHEAIPESVLANYFADKKMPRWGLVACLYGTPEQIEINLKIVQDAFEKEGGKFMTGKSLEGDQNAAHMERVMTGVTDLTEFGLYNFRGGGGSAWFAPAVPARSSDIIKSYTITSEVFNKYGFDYVGGFLLGVRHTEHVCDLLYDRSNPEEMQRAHDCFKEALAKNAVAGYGVYRTNTGFMDQASLSYGPEQNAFNQKLKRALDPNGIIAPGKSGIYI
jgi:4-cresol dehydrogenase (hydroxylating)